ncbi:hypothetical protein RFI_14574 [Reticulomyxa filosa]|uniref:Sulfatase N-terminal domain-containing protein n=1 Tax=Reticulomyxa filosa TaxID=46433 RepID=X6N8K6_RETFI|nr:hypothetical protein RFI_14574 [Reticulomyxa filosa]|eukprot:ETO22620.1 hypothetical protein RFI_14574 [Reticulomyxa filosa]
MWRTNDGNSRYYNYKITNENWQDTFYGEFYPQDYLTDNIKLWSLEFLRNYETFRKRYYKRELKEVAPFLMVISVPAAHNPFRPAPQYQNLSAKLPPAPRTPNFGRCGKDSGDKHIPVREAPCLDESRINHIDICYRERLGTLMSVDDLIYDVHQFIDKEMGLIDDTYFFFTSDNGYHLGQNSLMYEKRQPYETDIRVPFYVKGPG